VTPLRFPAFRFLAWGRLVTMLGNDLAPIGLAFAGFRHEGDAPGAAGVSVAAVLFMPGFKVVRTLPASPPGVRTPAQASELDQRVAEEVRDEVDEEEAEEHHANS
jgi:hypothetical protein